ncbi:hypothetical protein [Microcella alkalica]|uniref:Abi-like protein n=1 Tax=Microcella alkalica TaxID=355930 RepID=A0A839E4J2_9MICO|nr:hypothetical protein [Microcella alkalica]MBA8847599.1 hypothetical protein [Microcella alkalica]
MAKVQASLSPERLGPYLDACNRNASQAIRLYEWNVQVSGAFFESLGIVEVTVRNALSAQLTAHHGSLGGSWCDDPLSIFSAQASADIAKARKRVRDLGRPETPGRVIAELNFSFWKFLLARRYEATLWTPHLRHAFPSLQPQSRQIAFAALDGLTQLRNRVAHHEPIYRRDLNADMLTAFRVLNWIEPDVRVWAASVTRLPAVLAARPHMPPSSMTAPRTSSESE